MRFPKKNKKFQKTNKTNQTLNGKSNKQIIHYTDERDTRERTQERAKQGQYKAAEMRGVTEAVAQSRAVLCCVVCGSGKIQNKRLRYACACVC